MTGVQTCALPIWGVRGIRPRVLRSSISTAIALGVVSLLGLGLRSFTGRRRARAPQPLPARTPQQRWKLPLHGDVMPEEFAASAASGH